MPNTPPEGRSEGVHAQPRTRRTVLLLAAAALAGCAAVLAVLFALGRLETLLPGPPQLTPQQLATVAVDCGNGDPCLLPEKADITSYLATAHYLQSKLEPQDDQAAREECHAATHELGKHAGAQVGSLSALAGILASDPWTPSSPGAAGSFCLHGFMHGIQEGITSTAIADIPLQEVCGWAPEWDNTRPAGWFAGERHLEAACGHGLGHLAHRLAQADRPGPAMARPDEFKRALAECMRLTVEWQARNCVLGAAMSAAWEPNVDNPPRPQDCIGLGHAERVCLMATVSETVSTRGPGSVAARETLKSCWDVALQGSRQSALEEACAHGIGRGLLQFGDTVVQYCEIALKDDPFPDGRHDKLLKDCVEAAAVQANVRFSERSYASSLASATCRAAGRLGANAEEDCLALVESSTSYSYYDGVA